MVPRQRAAGCRSLSKIPVARVLRARCGRPAQCAPTGGLLLFLAHPAERGRLGAAPSSLRGGSSEAVAQCARPSGSLYV